MSDAMGPLFQPLGHIVPLKISLQTIDNHTWPASPLPTGVATATHQTRIVCIFTVITLCTMTDSFHQLHLTLVIVSLHLTTHHNRHYFLSPCYSMQYCVLSKQHSMMQNGLRIQSEWECCPLSALNDTMWQKHHCFPLFSIFRIFKGGVSLLLMLWWLCVENWKHFMWV